VPGPALTVLSVNRMLDLASIDAEVVHGMGIQ
jgi:hypothetical protein